MGMCLALRSVSNENISKILESPALIWRLIAPDDPEMYLASVSANRKGVFSRLFGKKSSETDQEIPELEFVEGENIEDDLDKSWQGIHNCLNKTDYKAEPPMDFITIGGKTAGDVDVGYGPARFFDSNTVKEIKKELSKFTIDKLRQNYDPSKMEHLDIYPSIWESDGEEAFVYVAEYFENLKSFVSTCSKHDLGMAVYLC